jgi:hypothetical protein
MEDGISSLLSFCSRIDFGVVELSREERAFQKEMSREMLSFCEYLPQSVRTTAVLFLMKYLHTSLKEGLNFINYFYPPAWSILFWLARTCSANKTLPPKYVNDAKVGHIMAMFLHAFDDHLTDNQVPVSHQALLMRSQAWMIMCYSFNRLGKGLEKGRVIISEFINDYYSSIDSSLQFESLDSYCDYFRKQMATWLIAPVLLGIRISYNEEFVQTIKRAYSSFGIAWRLLDDIQDLENDMLQGIHSSLYIGLPANLRRQWDQIKNAKDEQDEGSFIKVLNYIQKTGLINKIRQRICLELESAAAESEICGLPGYAAELRFLSKPLKNKWKQL